MLSKILVKLIDKAIIPALLLLVSRVVSIILISRYLGIHLTLNKAGFIFHNQSDYIRINSYSTLVMTGLLILGLGYVVIKSLFFHESHIKPSITSRLFSLKAESLIQNSYEIYTQGVVWLIYSYLLLVVSGIMALSNLMFDWVFYIIMFVNIITTLIFIFDLEEEVKIKKNTSEEYDMDQSFIELPGELE